jgi:hypothetical protein
LVQATGQPAGGGRWFWKAQLNKPEFHRKSGRWHLINRQINRRSDRYDEDVHDRETGQLVHECHERLTQQQGQGSAKRRG